MKGLELPINMIVIIAVAVLILVAIIAFFATQTGTGFDAVALNNAFNQGCNTLKSVNYNCAQDSTSTITTTYTKPGANTPATLLQVCTFKDPNLNSDTACRRACGCAI